MHEVIHIIHRRNVIHLTIKEEKKKRLFWTFFTKTEKGGNDEGDEQLRSKNNYIIWERCEKSLISETKTDKSLKISEK